MRKHLLWLITLSLAFGLLLAESPDIATLKEILNKAKSGDIEAQFQMSGYYAEGIGVEEDVSEAMRWMREAATGGHTEAQYRMGAFYSRDVSEAVQWFTKAGQNGHLAAQKYLGTHYAGSGKDEEKAFQWFLMAAQQHDVESAYEVGNMYFYGLGTEADHDVAFEYYRLAAEADYVPALVAVGECYLDGEGVAQDGKKAFKAFTQAAASNNASALYNLGYCYHTGQGTKMNTIRANAMYQLAVHFANENQKAAFQKYVDDTAAKLSLVDRAKADKIRDEWLGR